jgi:DNA-binding SARP family transcriptional activator/TolB-like protein
LSSQVPLGDIRVMRSSPPVPTFRIGSHDDVLRKVDQPSYPPVIRINTLGGLSVRGEDGAPLSGAAAQPRRMAILALLARAGERGISREKLLSLLWPDADDERGPRTLAQALYALRRDLGVEEAIVGSKDLRLDPALTSSDVSEFASALARGEDERAVNLYHGPFLDEFHLAGADEFSRWAERERAAIAAEHSRALESLARVARADGDARMSVAWWRKLAAIEPLNARVTVGLMDALAVSGDRAGAIQHARVYELLVEQELDLPPDKDVLAFAERLRQNAVETPSIVKTTAPARVGNSGAPAATTIADTPPPEPATIEVAEPARAPSGNAPTPPIRRIWFLTAALIVVATIGVAVAARARTGQTPASPGNAVVAIGNISAYGSDSAGGSLAAPVADLLTTSLARVRAIRVVSHGRMLELLHASGRTDTSTGAFLDAARQAGATQMIDGTLYTRQGGRLRLDLRRVDLATGSIGDVHTIEGADLFTLVDSGTMSLVSALGVSAPTGSIADVTTRSVTAYRMYEQGIHAYYLGDVRTAQRFFDGALNEDSTFALAAYYGAKTEGDVFKFRARIERARRLATHAADRERLTILAGWANTVSSPAMGAIAETLAARYPTEVEGHLYSGIAQVYDGDFLSALPSLQRVVTMDSLGLRGQRASCAGCDALMWIVAAYTLADSMAAAEREAHRWLRLQPHSKSPVYSLIQILEFQQRNREADSVFRVEVSDLPYADLLDLETVSRINAGAYSAADSMLREQLRQPDPRNQQNALWNLSLSLREQGRLTEALDAARRMRVPTATLLKQPKGQGSTNVMEAQLLLEQNNARAAATLFDSLSREHTAGETSSEVARTTVWMLAQAAGARYAAGDTASLVMLADSVRALAEQSGYGRDRRLHHYIRGLALAARGDDPGAIAEFRAAIYSTTLGFTRTNFEIGRAFMRLRRPREAIAILSPALRGAIEAQNLYVNRIELHELLAQAWDSAGQRDSAVAHYNTVARAWSAADPSFKARGDRCRERAAALAGKR